MSIVLSNREFLYSSMHLVALPLSMRRAALSPIGEKLQFDRYLYVGTSM